MMRSAHLGIDFKDECENGRRITVIFLDDKNLLGLTLIAVNIKPSI